MHEQLASVAMELPSMACRTLGMPVPLPMPQLSRENQTSNVALKHSGPPWYNQQCKLALITAFMPSFDVVGLKDNKHVQYHAGLMSSQVWAEIHLHTRIRPAQVHPADHVPGQP